jgi:hypothetical protein
MVNDKKVSQIIRNKFKQSPAELKSEADDWLNLPFKYIRLL